MTDSSQPSSDPPPPVLMTSEIFEDIAQGGGVAHRRDRLLAGLTLIAGIGLMLAMPFALIAGREFFLPVVVAVVVAIGLVPVLQSIERRRVPSWIAASICVIGFVIAVNVALAAIVVPASQWVQMLPQKLPQMQANLDPLLRAYADLEKFVDHSFEAIQSQSSSPDVQRAAMSVPRSALQFIATSAPLLLVQLAFTLLLIYFLLARWSDMRRRLIVNRASFSGALATARVIQNVVDATSTYLGTITIINLSLGVVVGVGVWMLGMPSPLMWGGVVALCNYVPYAGPVVAALFLLVGGLMTFQSVELALLPAVLMVVLHTIEANMLTPLLVGRRLTINPVMILISISFWAWVWGGLGALLAIPLLIIAQTVIRAAGMPDITGYLFDEGTLIGDRD